MDSLKWTQVEVICLFLKSNHILAGFVCLGAGFPIIQCKLFFHFHFDFCLKSLDTLFMCPVFLAVHSSPLLYLSSSGAMFSRCRTAGR